MSFDWYKEIVSSETITQGDIITDCAIPIPDESVYLSIITNDNNVNAIEIKTANVAILSQVCDIENSKIESVVISPVWRLSQLMQANQYYRSSRGKESLRQGKEPAYHLLNSHKSENISMDFSVVDFHQIYSLPKKYLREIVKNIDFRLRLLPPYREHLSQAFARYFMRVGLPLDISKEQIRDYKL